MDGILVIYKEKGFTSHDVVAKLRGILKMKKIGHTGTLDPEAEGVLPVCVGKATKLCDLLTDKDKTYEAVMKLGVITDTQDLTGTILEERNVLLSEDEIKEASLSFCGDYEQIPPMYSALKVNGKKLYELAREGIVVERKARGVKIYELVIKDINLETKEVTMKVTCSKGTYIRTLCHDIGEKLGCGACMKDLKRIRVERFLAEDSLTLSEVENKTKDGTIEASFIPIDQLFSHCPKIVIEKEMCRLVYNGNSFYKRNINKTVSDDCSHMEKEDGALLVRVYDNYDKFVGLYQFDNKKNQYKPYKMFL